MAARPISRIPMSLPDVSAATQDTLDKRGRDCAVSDSTEVNIKYKVIHKMTLPMMATTQSNALRNQAAMPLNDGMLIVAILKIASIKYVALEFI